VEDEQEKEKKKKKKKKKKKRKKKPKDENIKSASASRAAINSKCTRLVFVIYYCISFVFANNNIFAFC